MQLTNQPQNLPSQVLPKQPSPGSLSRVEQQILESGLGTNIRNSDIHDLEGALLLCFNLVGLSPTNFPDQAAKGVLIDFLLSNYPNYRIKELKTAFQLLAAGKLGEIEHFQNFSPMYFGKVMAAFTKRAEEVRKIEENSWSKQPMRPLYREDELSDEFCVEKSYENFLKQGKWQLIYPGCYQTLLEHNLGLPDDEVFDHRKKFENSIIGETMFPETRERRFAQYLTGIVFSNFEGKRQRRVFAFPIYEKKSDQEKYVKK